MVRVVALHKATLTTVRVVKYHGFEGVEGERGDSITVTRQLVERREGAKVIHIGLEG